jgi:DNA-binding transcriptional MerR regulator
MARVSLRQLQWWDEKKLIMPDHDSHRRWYSRRQAFEVCLVADLRRRGISVQKIRKLLRRFRPLAVQSEQRLKDLYLITNGYDIVCLAAEKDVLAALLRFTKAVFVLELANYQVLRMSDQ